MCVCVCVCVCVVRACVHVYVYINIKLIHKYKNKVGEIFITGNAIEAPSVERSQGDDGQATDHALHASFS